jgi:hypothetical protein
MPLLKLLPTEPTAFAALSRREARACLALAVTITAVLVVVSLTQNTGLLKVETPPDPNLHTHDDFYLYAKVSHRCRNGEFYYDVAFDEQRKNRFPTVSPFNFRLPAYAVVIAAAPNDDFARFGLCALAFAMVVLAFCSELRNGGVLVALPTFLFLAAFASWSPDPSALAWPDYWAALLIGLSAAAFGLNLSVPAVVAGILALAFRELALPWCVACAALAVLGRRRGEWIGWIVGLALFAGLLIFHIIEVQQRQSAADTLGKLGDWLAAGGFRLFLATARMNPLLIDVPGWKLALVTSAALLGLAGWSTPQGRRVALAVFLYVIAYTIVGNPYNHYWGMIYATLLPYGLGRAPFALRDLFVAARFRTPDKTPP